MRDIQATHIIKRMNLKRLTVVAFFIPFYSFAKIPAQLTFSLGSISTNYAESESNLESTDGSGSTTQEAYSNTASSMPIEVGFEYYSSLKRSYFFKAGGPFMGSTPDRFFFGNTGINFYFSQIGSPILLQDEKLKISIQPKFRYYAGPQIGAAYLVYNTKSQTKNDIIVEVGGQAGAIYSINQKWGLRAQGEFTKGTGAIVGTTTIKVLLGATYNLNSDN